MRPESIRAEKKRSELKKSCAAAAADIADVAAQEEKKNDQR